MITAAKRSSLEIEGTICPFMSRSAIRPTNVLQAGGRRRDATCTVVLVAPCRRDCPLFVPHRKHRDGGRCALAALAREAPA